MAFLERLGAIETQSGPRPLGGRTPGIERAIGAAVREAVTDATPEEITRALTSGNWRRLVGLTALREQLLDVVVARRPAAAQVAEWLQALGERSVTAAFIARLWRRAANAGHEAWGTGLLRAWFSPDPTASAQQAARDAWLKRRVEEGLNAAVTAEVGDVGLAHTARMLLMEVVGHRAEAAAPERHPLLAPDRTTPLSVLECSLLDADLKSLTVADAAVAGRLWPEESFAELARISAPGFSEGDAARHLIEDPTRGPTFFLACWAAHPAPDTRYRLYTLPGSLREAPALGCRFLPQIVRELLEAVAEIPNSAGVREVLLETLLVADPAAWGRAFAAFMRTWPDAPGELFLEAWETNRTEALDPEILLPCLCASRTETREYAALHLARLTAPRPGLHATPDIGTYHAQGPAAAAPASGAAPVRPGPRRGRP